MIDTRWFEIDREFARSEKHFELGIGLFEASALGGDDFDSEIKTLAFLHAMQSGYTACEAAFVRIIEMLGEDIPTGHDWHKQLLQRLRYPLSGEQARPPVVSPLLADELEELRKFRHIAIHVYDEFDPHRAVRAVESAKRMLPLLKEEVHHFRTIIDPD